MSPHEGRKILERFWAAVHANDFRTAGELLHEEYVLVWPQSGESIRGRANWVAVNEHYPAAGPWRVSVHRIIADETGVATDVTVTDGVVAARALTFSELRDGKIVGQTEFWPDSFAPAPWRSQWVERVT